MTIDQETLSHNIKEIKQMFLYYGFLKCPLTTKNIINLLLRGYTKNEIYNFGCDRR
mgnify:CR=1 FL=1|tara:strand:+ start:802 stop:969 length:168 start_codon:yes stop_codon:yes gene_type:complete